MLHTDVHPRLASILVILFATQISLAESTPTPSSPSTESRSVSSSGWNPPAPEVRLIVGANSSRPSDLNTIVPERDHIERTVSFGADIIADFDTFGFGVRFDSISFFNGMLTDLHGLEVASRVFSILTRYRWSFDERFVGPIATYGFYVPSVVNIRPEGGGWDQYEADRQRSLSIGLEAGWIWGVYLVGFEGGYQSLQLSDLATNSGTPLLSTSGSALTVDLDGMYAKFLLGLHF